MAQGTATVNKIFKANKGSSLPVVTMFKLEPDTAKLQDIILIFGEPVERWHSDQNKTNRSCKGTCDWFLDECTGKFMEPLCDVMSIFSDSGKLQECGFTVHDIDLPLNLAGLDEHESHPIVQEEHERAAVAGVFGLELVAARLTRCLWFLEGWPAKSSLFYHASEEVRARAASKFAKDLHNHNTIAKEGGVFWKAVNRRSVFNTTAVKQIAAILEESEGKVTPAVQAHHRSKYSGLMASQVNEDGFQRERRAQADTQNGNLTYRRAWQVLLDKQVTTKVHNFSPIPPSTAPMARGKDCILPKEAFYPSPTQVSANCNLQGIRKNGDWFKCTAETGNAPFADMALREHVVQHGREAIDKGSNAWLS